MSISENVGALNNHSSPAPYPVRCIRLYAKAAKSSSSVPPIKEFVKTEEHVKGLVSPLGTMFEQLGFNYIGPIDGHNIDELITTF